MSSFAQADRLTRNNVPRHWKLPHHTWSHRSRVRPLCLQRLYSAISMSPRPVSRTLSDDFAEIVKPTCALRLLGVLFQPGVNPFGLEPDSPSASDTRVTELATLACRVDCV